MEITKQQVIKAIKTEPLGAQGYYAQTSLNEKSLAKRMTKKCVFCAVGAVIKSVGVKPASRIDDVGQNNTRCPTRFTNGDDQPTRDDTGAKAEAERLVSLGGEYAWDALSSLYEHQMSQGYSVADVRKTLVAFVKKTFPKKVNLDV